jgi:hypothetical protein
MKKRILLSLVSFFAMTAMWASLTQNYRLSVTAAENGKANAEAELTLNLKNTGTFGVLTWACTVTLPEGVTYVDGSFAPVDGRFTTAPTLTAVVNEDGTVTFSCECAGEEVVQGSEGPVATFKVAVGDVEPGDYAVSVKNENFVIKDGPIQLVTPDPGDPYTWTIEAGSAGLVGDVNLDGTVDIADAVCVLNAMAEQSVPGNPDVNNDGEVDIADLVTILNIMAAQ